jgi:hypothetical protein
LRQSLAGLVKIATCQGGHTQYGPAPPGQTRRRRGRFVAGEVIEDGQGLAGQRLGQGDVPFDGSGVAGQATEKPGPQCRAGSLGAFEQPVGAGHHPRRQPELGTGTAKWGDDAQGQFGVVGPGRVQRPGDGGPQVVGIERHSRHGRLELDSNSRLERLEALFGPLRVVAGVAAAGLVGLAALVQAGPGIGPQGLQQLIAAGRSVGRHPVDHRLVDQAG